MISLNQLATYPSPSWHSCCNAWGGCFIPDPAQLKNFFSTYTACLDMTVTLVNSTRAQALHMIWALCEVAKEEKSWSAMFDSIDQFIDSMPDEAVMMLLN